MHPLDPREGAATVTTAAHLQTLAPIISEVIEPDAPSIDRDAKFPRAALEAMGRSGLLGLVSAEEVGGSGGGIAEACDVVGEIAARCGSTAMVVTMHYAAAMVIEAHGSNALRERVARGDAIATLAFSEAGSRSHFWAPVSTATRDDDARVRLDAKKSWVTSAGEADVYVWSSRPLEAEGVSTIWAVPASADGLSNPAPFDGLGLRGNASSPVTADGVIVDEQAMLGADGGGFDVMMSTVLPAFTAFSGACCTGLMRGAVAGAAAHVGATSFEHLDGSRLADLPTIRAYLARMQVKTDQVGALLDDTLAALASGRDDAMLRVLEIKAAAGEAATEVTDLAMRVCGGAAFRKEVGVERRFRDARAATIMAPTTDVLYDFIGKAVVGMPLF
jgi:alkylation response protein AidB-like acyl-CoA dehydrogenase